MIFSALLVLILGIYSIAGTSTGPFESHHGEIWLAARQNAPKSQRLNHAARRSSFQDDKATPVLKARDDVPTLCVDDAVASPWPGYLVCHDSTGWPMSCDSCMGRNGDPPASTIAGGDFCDVIVDSNNYNRTACPGDPAPSTLPDGTSVPEDIANGFIQTFCVFVGSDPPLELATWLACFMWGYTHTKDILEEQMFGITVLCDTLFAGICTFFESGAGQYTGGD